MAAIIEPGQPLPGDPLGPDELDFSELRCPACGSNDITVSELPADSRGSWWGSGKARCNYCGRHFRLTAEPSAD